MQSFIADSAAFTGDSVTITGDEHFHATRSCRVRPGELIGVTDGRGRRVEARIEAIDGSSLTASVVRDLSGRGEPPVPVTVALALIKPARFETAAEKCTELGARAILPFVSERCAVGRDRLNTGRLARIVREAAKQAGRSWIPAVGDVVDIAELAAPGRGPLLVADIGATEDIEAACGALDLSRGVTVAVGPEGDFTDGERGLMRGCGAALFTMGGLVLRAETAAITAVALTVSHLGRQWT